MFLRLMRFDALTRIFSFRVGLGARIFLPFLYHQLALDTFAYPFQKKKVGSAYIFSIRPEQESELQSHMTVPQKS